ncbi:hypothetical protein [Paraburkholderia bannensis]|uniref:hypothetical protein n=1 Tax=Paraburkholderia bannensis TaxID=765414 RepID=UPI002ABDD3CF|nr:hypothetical protein [Paraburkholderia bannensis]
MPLTAWVKRLKKPASAWRAKRSWLAVTSLDASIANCCVTVALARCFSTSAVIAVSSELSSGAPKISVGSLRLA